MVLYYHNTVGLVIVKDNEGFLYGFGSW